MGPKRQKLRFILQRYMPLAFVGVMVVLMLMPLRPEEKTRLMTAFRDFLHFPASFILFWICLNLKWLRWKSFSRETTCAIFVQGFHTVLELMQPFLHRSASWVDWFLGLGGVLAAYLVYKALLVRGRHWRKRTLLAAVGLAGLGLVPTLLQAADRLIVRRDFPMLGSFETRLELKRWNLYGFKGGLSGEHVRAGKHAVRLTETKDFSYSGWFMEEMKTDWSPYERLVFSIFWTGAAPRKGDVRVDDLPESSYAQQGHFTFVLQPGANRIEVPLARLFQTESGRKVEGDKIWKFGISMLEKQNQSVLFVDDIRLE
ncbi:MAG: hypothetical protein ACI9TH_001090 [Kiritimatiellia bacterium]|jgi:hypothetical protein